jgi:hypothetical protein
MHQSPSAGKESPQLSRITSVDALRGFVMFMMIFVMPKLLSILKESGAPLPWTTRVLLFATNVMQNYWWLLLLLLIAAIIAFILAYQVFTGGTVLYTFGATTSGLTIPPDSGGIPIRIIFTVDAMSAFMDIICAIVGTSVLFVFTLI